MLRVECESCKAPYQVDERRIPAAGLKMRCPKCSHVFTVRNDGSMPSMPPPGATPPPVDPALKRTMIGVAPRDSAELPAAKAPVPAAGAKPPPHGAAARPTVPAARPPIPAPAARPPIAAGAAPLARPAAPALGAPGPARPQGAGKGAVPALARPEPPGPNTPTTKLPTTGQALLADAKAGAIAQPAKPTPAAPAARPPTRPSAPDTPLPPVFGSFDEADLLPAPRRRADTLEADYPAVPLARPITGPIAQGPPTPREVTLDFELDLPSVPGSPEADLPAVAAHAPPVAAKAKAAASPRARPGEPSSIGLDLPPIAIDLPAIPSPRADLPSPSKSAAKADPPSLAGGAGSPAASAPRARTPSAPPLAAPGSPPRARAPSAPPLAAPSFGAGAMGGSGRASSPRPIDDLSFGEIDLPVVADAPFVGLDLPSASAPLPQVAAGLPSNAAALPAPAAGLPRALDSTPMRATPGRTPSSELELDRFDRGAAAPSHGAGAPSAAPSFDDLAEFGELDLPPGPPPPMPMRLPSSPAIGSVPPLAMPAAPGLDIPGRHPSGEMAAPTARAAAPPEPAVERPEARTAAAGGMAFGEVDLGGEADLGSPALEEEEAAPPPTRPSQGVVRATAPAAEADLGSSPPSAPVDAAKGEEAALPTAPARSRERPSASPKRRGPRVALAIVALLVAGGAALELTPAGAYGRNVLGDVIHAGEYRRATAAAGGEVRAAFSSDVYEGAKAAADAAGAAHAGAPRARSLAAYAALAEYELELRFGPDAARATRAAQWLAELPPGENATYAPAARALRDASGPDLDKARRALDDASKRDGGDPVQEEIAWARGDLELRARAAPDAAAAYRRALAMHPSARAHFGLARAHALARDLAGARTEIAATLAASPRHAGARVLRARIAFEEEKADDRALADLAAVIDGEDHATSAPSEQAAARAQRGWIHLARGRSDGARADFDAALALEPRNVDALLGQGEVLFSEGRYTEALARFDAAVSADPASLPAIVSDAKAKIALERLADAKGQLAAARAADPKDMRVALWLGKAEEALGNKDAAEKGYLAAIDLIDPARPEAIAPYVAISELLAGQGRAKDAHARLDEARAKLPDSAAMQRALGEVAAAEGAFDEAIAHYKIAMEKEPGDLSTRFKLGVTLRRMRKSAEAQVELDGVLAADKDYPGLALERGLLYEESGDVDRALEQFQSALAKAPDDPDLELRVGAAYTAIGRPGDAVPILRKVMEKRPASAEAQHYLGRALFLQGPAKQAEAMRFLRRAVELDPNRAEYHLYVAWAANNADPAQLGLAKDEIEKALALDKLLADAYWQRGDLERKEGAVDDAMKDLKHALDLRPSRIEAHASLAECLEDKNQPVLALAEWKKAVDGDEHQPFWRFRYGKLLVERGSIAEAVKHLVYAVSEGEKADAHPGWLANAEFQAATALRKTGKRADAAEKYRRFLELAPASSPDRKEAQSALAELGAGP